MLYSKDNGHVKFSFCYPQGWEALERERPLGSWYLSFSKPGETKTKTLYIQMQLSSHDLELDKRLFANHQATQAPQFKNEEKRVVLKDTPTEFHIFERVLSSHSQISNTITYYVVNPQTSPHQIMRFWFDYEDNAPLSDVREESQVFAEVIESFKWDKN
ncbi:MAG TPA: hypothetical protein VD999_01580 [Vitreimonas sp.]|nr:hypothetical protein [Vitreimonas sp.]